MPSPQTVSADDLISPMPAVNNAAVDAAGGAPDVAPSIVLESAPAPDVAPELDGRGTPFDPERHIHTQHPGTRVWMPRRRAAVAPAPDEPSFVAPDPAPASASMPTAAAVAAAADPAAIAADTCIGIVQTALVMLGEDEGVLTANERTMLRAPLERVLRKYSVGAMPAELDLAVAIAVLVIARLKKPKTMARFERLKLWFRLRAADRRGVQQAAAVARAVG